MLAYLSYVGDVRAIISKGWSARMSKQQDLPEVEMPEECYSLDKVPHEFVTLLVMGDLANLINFVLQLAFPSN